MFRPMDPTLLRSLLEGQHDVLSEEAKEETKLYQSTSCPMCYEVGGCEKRIRPPKIIAEPDGPPTVVSSPFISGRDLPQGYAHCIHCGTDFDPRSGIIMKTEASTITPVDFDPAATIVSPPSNPRRG